MGAIFNPFTRKLVPVVVPDVSGKLDKVSGSVTALSEVQAAVHDATTGTTATIDYADGNIQEITADDTAFTIAKGTWPSTDAESMLIYLKTSAATTITWSGWSFVNTGNEPDGSNAASYGLYEILQVGGEFFIFVVEEA